MDETRNDAPLTGEAPQPAKPQPLRRVGSFTLGVCLIAAGIFFLLAYFVPGVDWKLMLKIAPAAGLILLGGEVLFFAARPGRWKYDFWSVLICLLTDFDNLRTLPVGGLPPFFLLCSCMLVIRYTVYSWYPENRRRNWA